MLFDATDKNSACEVYVFGNFYSPGSDLLFVIECFELTNV